MTVFDALSHIETEEEMRNERKKNKPMNRLDEPSI